MNFSNLSASNTQRTGQPRDSQRKKLYEAERLIDGFSTADRIEDIGQCQAFVDQMLAHKWIRETYPWLPRHITVHDGRGCRNATGGQSQITLPKWARAKLVIVHEFTHVCILSKERRDGKKYAWHGREYAAAYLDIVRHYLGQAKFEQLREAFRTKNVRYKAKRAGTKTGNPDALAAWRAKQAAAKIAAPEAACTPS